MNEVITGLNRESKSDEPIPLLPDRRDIPEGSDVRAQAETTWMVPLDLRNNPDDPDHPTSVANFVRSYQSWHLLYVAAHLVPGLDAVLENGSVGKHLPRLSPVHERMVISAPFIKRAPKREDGEDKKSPPQASVATTERGGQGGSGGRGGKRSVDADSAGTQAGPSGSSSKGKGGDGGKDRKIAPLPGKGGKGKKGKAPARR